MLLEMQQDSGVTPKALENRPDLLNRWQYPYEVYSVISGSRRYTMGGSAHIPLSEFLAFATMYQLTMWHARELWQDVRLIDSLTLEARAQQRDLKQTKK